MKAWFAQHRAALASALRRLWANPLNTALSLLVIGIALTLPGFGYVLLDNLRELGSTASGVQQVSLFMELDASRKEVGEIENRLRQAGNAKWRFVPKEEALKHMQASEGMAEIVASLPRNPLPDAFIIEPANTGPEALEILRKEIAGWPKVAHVQLDSAWIKRFDAFLRLARLALLMLAGIFAAGLVAVTFNTIRLQVMAQAAEIEVARLVGLLAPPVAELAGLYGSSFALTLPGPWPIAALTGVGAFLGWLGAQLSVSLSLRRFD